MSKIALLFANGTEEVEALTVVDVLRRAQLDLDIVSITGEKKVTGSHNITIEADAVIEEYDFDSIDMLVIPGGMPGTNNIEAHPLVQEAIKKLNAKGKYLCAICAAPKVLGHAGILTGKKACAYPGVETELTGANVSFDEVSVDGKVITSRGLGTAIPFSLACLEALTDTETATDMAKKIVFKQM